MLFGRTVGTVTSADAVGRMYSTFLEHTSITSEKKMHITRRAFPTVLEDFGCVFLYIIYGYPATMFNLFSVPADQVDAVGHWQGNTRREVYASKIPKAVRSYYFKQLAMA